MNIPYMTLVSFFLCFFLISIENIGLLVKIAGYGVLTIISFVVFIIYIFFYGIFEYD